MTSRRQMTEALTHLDVSRLVFPASCFFCEEETATALCEACSTEIDSLRGKGCQRCMNPSVGVHADHCVWCERLKNPPDQIASAFAYRQKAREIFHVAKFNGYFRFIKPLVARAQPVFFDRIDFLNYDCLVPVPETFQRMRRRMFNPAELIARELSACSGLPVRRCLKSVFFRRRQVGLGLDARRANIRNRFKLSRKPPKHVILVDDVITSGATMTEVTAALRRGGVERIAWFSLFRTP